MSLNLSDERICVTGGGGFLGKHVIHRLQLRACEVVYVPQRNAYDLRNPIDVWKLIDTFKPGVIIHLAATCGGIGFNLNNATRLFADNMMMGTNLIEIASILNVRKFVFIGTVCSYPADCPVPFVEEDLWEGEPEPTNAPYGIAKRALGAYLQAVCGGPSEMRGAYVIPTNLYGPGDKFDEARSHVIPALIRKFVKAKADKAPSITLWGTGKATRDFLFVSDAAEGIVRAAERIDDPMPINLSSATEVSISALAKNIAKLVGWDGEIIFDQQAPDGQNRRCVSNAKAAELLDWGPKMPLKTGLRETAEWWLDSVQAAT